MLPVDTSIWGDQIPGHIPDSDEEDDSASEEDAFQATCEERLDAVSRTLGPRLIEVPMVEFAAAQLHQRGASTLKVNPMPATTFGTRLPTPSFQINNICAPIVAKTFLGNGMLPTATNDWAVRWSGPISDSSYQNLNEFQRVNHFPGSTELTRKDRLWKHFNEMKQAFGSDSFDFVPDSYVIPNQVEQFLDCYERTDWTWIVKPSSGAQGKGIFLLRHLSELPLDECSVVSRYVDNPLLIQGLKWDLRIYVLVTSYTPLRAYIYREGLTRFASSPYSMEPEHLADAYRHLTNYSVNKTATNFVENQEVESDNFGHKWSLSALNKHLKCVGINVNLMWARIMDLIVKTLLSVEPSIAAKTRSVTVHPNCFECYGFDVLVDDQLKPWLLEVNLSPSMKAESPLDWKVKSSLLADAFNLVGIRSPDRQAVSASRLRTRILQVRQATINSAQNQASRFARRTSFDEARSPSCGDPRTPSSASKASARQPPSGRAPSSTASASKPLKAVDLDRLNEDQLKMLAQALQEVKRCHKRTRTMFIRLHPTSSTCERYWPIWDGKGPHSSDFSVGSSATRLLASVLFGAPFTGTALGERRLTRPRCTLGSRDSCGHETRGPRELRDLNSPKQEMMQSLETKSTKSPSEDDRTVSDHSDAESDEAESSNLTYSALFNAPFRHAQHVKEHVVADAKSSGPGEPRPGRTHAGESAGEPPGFQVTSPTSLPRSLFEGHRLAARPSQSRTSPTPSPPLSPPPRHVGIHGRSKSTPVLPKLIPEAAQPFRIRHDSGQWIQTEAPPRVKSKQNMQLTLEALLALNSDIEL